MKTLYLARHAKSSWRNAELDDIDRPLKERGVRNAYAVGAYLQRGQHMPDLLISSPAARAFHTAIIYARQLDYPMHSVRISEVLYHGGFGGIIELLRSLDDSIEHVMVFGHNPTFTDLANELSDGYLENLPTAGVAQITFDTAQWADLTAERNGKLEQVITPKEVQ